MLMCLSSYNLMCLTSYIFAPKQRVTDNREVTENSSVLAITKMLQLFFQSVLVYRNNHGREGRRLTLMWGLFCVCITFSLQISCFA